MTTAHESACTSSPAALPLRELEEPDIQAVASLLIEQFGHAAPAEAGLRLGYTLLSRDDQAAEAWLRITRAIGAQRRAMKANGGTKRQKAPSARAG